MRNETAARLQEYGEAVQRKLKELCPPSQETPAQEKLAEAMNYSLSAGGKRIRPALVLEFCRLCGGKREQALTAAAAVEMIHTFSLIHDDLPCMDDDDLRRGKPSCHKAYGEAAALLAGDALENLAFGVLAEDDANPPEIRVRLIAELSRATGLSGMIGGQAMDLELEGTPADEPSLRKMVAGKTGALLSCACRMGCIAGGGSSEQVEAAAKFAEKMGLAFQIVDDILDVTGTEAELGKPIGSDREQEKSTFVTLLGLEKASALAEALTKESIGELSAFSGCDFLTDLTWSLARRNK